MKNITYTYQDMHMCCRMLITRTDDIAGAFDMFFMRRDAVRC